MTFTYSEHDIQELALIIKRLNHKNDVNYHSGTMAMDLKLIEKIIDKGKIENGDGKSKK